MPLFKLNRTLNFVSLQGPSANFVKGGEPQYLPEFCRQEIENMGGEEVGDGAQAPQPEKELTAAERKAVLKKAFDDLTLASGVTDKAPNVADVNKATGLKLSATERDAAWDEYLAG